MRYADDVRLELPHGSSVGNTENMNVKETTCVDFVSPI